MDVPTTSERLVVSKEAHVTEEVALRKQAGERQETVRETVRSSDVEVENTSQRAKGGKGKQS